MKKQAFNVISKVETDRAWRSVGLAGMPKFDVNASRDITDKSTGVGACADMIKRATVCPTTTIPPYEQTRATTDGPMTDTAISTNLGAQINLFDLSPGAVGFSTVTTTMAKNGIPQVPLLILGLYFWVEIESREGVIKCNWMTHPTAAQRKPVSPDTYAAYDLLTAPAGADAAIVPLNTLGLATGQTMVPGFINVGYWQTLAALYLSRGFDWVWRFGRNTTLMSDVLRNRMYLVPGAQEGTGSSSEQDAATIIRQTNDYYDGLNSTLNALGIDYVRLGPSNTMGAGAAIGSLYRPSRAFDTFGVTYGGSAVRSQLMNAVKGNPEVYKLPCPLLWDPAVPYGLELKENDTDFASKFRDAMSISQFQTGIVPSSFTDEANINAGSSAGGAALGALSNVGFEPTINPAAANTVVASPIVVQRVVGKFGPMSFTQGLVALEIPRDVYTNVCSDSTLRQIIESECGCQVLA